MKHIVSICMLFLLTKVNLIAQNTYPPQIIDEPVRNTCYLYALGEAPFNTGVKVMIISTYIHRQKYKDYHVLDDYGNASKFYYIGLLNAFNKKLDDIEADEHYLHTTATGTVLNGNIILRSNVVEAHFGLVYAEGFCPSTVGNLPSSQHKSTTDYSYDCRQRFIDEKRREGYHVFQVAFDQYYETSLKDLYSSKEFNAAKDEVRALSPLYVETYRPGVIKNIAGYQAKKGSNSSGKKNNNAASGSNKPKETDEERQARMQLKMTMAYSLEREGDAYYQKGSLFYKEAYNRYKASYQMYPLPSVQKKISDMETMMRVAQSVDRFGKKVDDLVFSLDPDGKTNHTIGFLQYNGLAGTESQTNLFNRYRLPSDVWFGITGQRLFLSFQARMGYMQTGNVEVSARMKMRGSSSDGQIVDTVLINNAGLGLGLSAGINIPIKRIQLYALYGYEFRVGIAGNLYSDAFRFEDSKDANDVLPLLQRRIEAGVNVLIPKTRVGFGANYTFLALRTKADVGPSSLLKLNPTAADANGTNYYVLDSYTRSSYRYGNVGIKFFWMLN